MPYLRWGSLTNVNLDLGKLTVKMTEENWKILVESGARSRYEVTKL